MRQHRVITLFPEMLKALTEQGVTGRAVRDGLVEIECINPRDFTTDPHRTVDDRPYGGGPGMVMRPEPLLAAIDAARDSLSVAGAKPASVIYVSPQGRKFDQAMAQRLSETERVVWLCGRYEGVDERVVELAVDEEWSLGDFVVSGGELPVMTMLDAAIRLIPGALGHAASAAEDSFSEGLLDCPHYTRPEQLGEDSVPPVLLSGNHREIARWRRQQALLRTRARRPDMLEQVTLTDAEKNWLLTQTSDDG